MQETKYQILPHAFRLMCILTVWGDSTYVHFVIFIPLHVMQYVYTQCSKARMDDWQE